MRIVAKRCDLAEVAQTTANMALAKREIVATPWGIEALAGALTWREAEGIDRYHKLRVAYLRTIEAPAESAQSGVWRDACTAPLAVMEAPAEGRNEAIKREYRRLGRELFGQNRRLYSIVHGLWPLVGSQQRPRRREMPALKAAGEWLACEMIGPNEFD